jgi:hypothetical protein
MVPYLQFVQSGGPAQLGTPAVSSGKSAKSLCIASNQSEQPMHAGDDDTLSSLQDMNG